MYVGNRPLVLADCSGCVGEPPKFTAQEIDEALDKGFTSKEGAYKRKPLKGDLDHKVARKGAKAGGVNGLGASAANLDIKDSTTNQQSKKHFISDAPEAKIKPFEVPVIDAPEEMKRAAGEKIIVGGFDKPDELNKLVSDIETRQADKTKSSTQKIREGIREGNAPKTAASLEAAGMDPKTLTMGTPEGVPQFPKGDLVQLAPNDAPMNPKTGQVIKAAEEALEKGGKTILQKLGTKALKVIPFVGIGAGLYSAKAEAAQGNYGTATLEVIGLVPVVGDVVDAARLGVAIGEAINDFFSN